MNTVPKPKDIFEISNLYLLIRYLNTVSGNLKVFTDFVVFRGSQKIEVFGRNEDQVLILLFCAGTPFTVYRT